MANFCRGDCRAGLAPSQLTLEIVEDAEVDLLRLQRCMDSYRRFGFKLALDDFGASNSACRAWLLEPDAVKAARTPAASRLVAPAARDALPRAVNILHAAGCQVIAEGVDTARHAELAGQAGCDGRKAAGWARCTAGRRPPVPKSARRLTAMGAPAAFWHAVAMVFRLPPGRARAARKRQVMTSRFLSATMCWSSPAGKNSGPEHWQSRWQDAHPTWQRVQQADWLTPSRADWVATLDAAVADRPVLLVRTAWAAPPAHWAAQRQTALHGWPPPGWWPGRH